MAKNLGYYIDFTDESLTEVFGKNPLFDKNIIDIDCGHSEELGVKDQLKTITTPSVGEQIKLPERVGIYIKATEHPYIDKMVGYFSFTGGAVEVKGVEEKILTQTLKEEYTSTVYVDTPKNAEIFLNDDYIDARKKYKYIESISGSNKWNYLTQQNGIKRKNTENG